MTSEKMFWLFENDIPVAQFTGPSDLAGYLINHPETHDYELVDRTFHLRFRAPFRLEKTC